MALLHSVRSQHIGSLYGLQPLIQRRCFAKAKEKKNQSTLTQLRADKTTQQYAEILDWWNNTKQSRLDLSILSPELRSDFIEKRTRYKEGNITRINKMKETIAVSSQRKQDALNALPARLAFICKTSRAPKWTSELSKSVKDSYYNLHHTAKTSPSTTSSLHLESNKYYDIHKLRHKQKEEIAVLDDERMHKIHQYKFPSTPLEHFPPIYDPGDIRTQSAYVRSYFDYTYTEGMDVPIKEKEYTIDPDAHLNDEERRQIYGHDYAGVQLSKVVHVENLGGGGIGGTEDLKKKLQQEEEAHLTAKQKLQKERGKKTAEARAEANKKMEKIRQAKLRVKESVDQWDKSIKMGERKKKRKEMDSDEDEESRQKKKEDAERRIDELEMLNKDLPSMEALLVDKDKNKEFFEKTLPVMLNHEFLDDDKREECIKLVRKYHTLQTHVGYGVR